MKKVLMSALLSLAALCFPDSLMAQFVGYTSPQTVFQQIFGALNTPLISPLSNPSAGPCSPGGATACAIPNLGQTQHFIIVRTSAQARFKLVLEATNDGSIFFPIAEATSDGGQSAGNPTPQSILSASGSYAGLRLNLIAITLAGSLQAWYSGSSATVPTAGGSVNGSSLYRRVLAIAPNASGATLTALTTVVYPPAANTAGTFFFQFITNNCAGGSIAVFSGPDVAHTTALTTLTPANVTTLQAFTIPTQVSATMTFAYTTCGTETYDAFMLFSPPGSTTGSTSIPTQVNTEGQKASYRAAIAWAPPAAAATDILVIGGSATKTVRVTHVSIACTATAAIAADVIFIKRSAADTAGTSTAATLVPLDSSDAAATNTVLAYTANPTINGTVGNVSMDKASITTTTGAPQLYFEDFGIRNTRSVVLRGTAQQLAINLNGQTIAGLACDAETEWTEE